LAVALRAYRWLAVRLNGRLCRALNDVRYAEFQETLTTSQGPRLYVIVMPHTLHYLLPCLALLQGHAQLLLIHNGARRWERRFLRCRLPRLPMFNLRCIPGSSVGHGEVISLLLRHSRGNFGIVDHDCYIFDSRLLSQLDPAATECMVGVFEQYSQRTGVRVPLTHFLYFNGEALRGLMECYGIDARQCRRAPAAAAAAMAVIGLGPHVFFKDYHDFHDTLHVLLAVALFEGLHVRYLPLQGEASAIHVGGTSIGTHHTKNLFALYVHLRFMELLDDPQVTARYAFLARPLASSAEALARRNAADPAWDRLQLVDTLMRSLHAAGVARAFEFDPQNTSPAGATR
jgi:hypothetical protein